MRTGRVVKYRIPLLQPDGNSEQEVCLSEQGEIMVKTHNREYSIFNLYFHSKKCLLGLNNLSTQYTSSNLLCDLLIDPRHISKRGDERGKNLILLKRHNSQSKSSLDNCSLIFE